ncbi:choline transporter of high affinity [Haemophilus influenzae]|uniref:Choline transporter of high affinity n=1 Tax=Haemophilus influenzae TaxID=727 RepID=A0A2X1PU46_HAEIF|nr:choline transporter of high affinity [Haemophilus influenzae]
MAMIFIAPEQTQALLNQAKSGIFANFSWFYVLTFSVFLGFLLILSVSSLGNIKLGQDEEEPEFSFFILACDVICRWNGGWADVFWRSRTINPLSF